LATERLSRERLGWHPKAAPPPILGQSEHVSVRRPIPAWESRWTPPRPRSPPGAIPTPFLIPSRRNPHWSYSAQLGTPNFSAASSEALPLVQHREHHGFPAAACRPVSANDRFV